MKIRDNGPPVVEIDLSTMTDDEALEALSGLPDEMMAQVAYRGPAKRVIPFLAHMCSVEDVEGKVIIHTRDQ